MLPTLPTIVAKRRTPKRKKSRRSINGRMDVQSDERVGGQSDGWTDEWMDGQMDGWTVDGWMDTRMDGRMDEWTDGVITRCTKLVVPNYTPTVVLSGF